MKNQVCPRCNSPKYWNVRKQKLKCARCHYEWSPHRLPLRLSRDQWKEILSCFVQDQSSNEITSQTGMAKKRILRALQQVRIAMEKDLPSIFDGNVEVGHTRLDGRWKIRKSLGKSGGEKRRRPKRKTIYVLGVLSRNTGDVWTTVVSNLEMKQTATKIRKKIKLGSIIYSNYAYGFFYSSEDFPFYIPTGFDLRPQTPVQTKSSGPRTLNEFWKYLKANLRHKAGIRLSKLPLYVASYTWLYNQRKLTGKVDLLLERLEYYARAGVV